MSRIVVGFRGGLEEGVVAKLVGLEGVGDVAGGHEQKYEENEEENDLPGCRRRRQRRRHATHGRRREWVGDRVVSNVSSRLQKGALGSSEVPPERDCHSHENNGRRLENDTFLVRTPLARRCGPPLLPWGNP